MLKKILILTVMLLPSSVFAENLFSNSDMSTTGAWRGSRSFTTLDGEKVLVMKASPRRIESFSQGAATRGMKDVVVSFRYMSPDYSGRGFQLRGHRPDGSSTFRSFNLTSDGQWHNLSWRFSEIRNCNKIDFTFDVLEGDGTIYFDDVKVTEAK